MQKRSNLLFGAALTALTMIGTALPVSAARAQAVKQYVVVYGEFKPDPWSIRQGNRTLEYLQDLARKSAGVIHFASYTKIGRPNSFSLIELWQDSASLTAFQKASNTQKALADLQPHLIAPLDERDGTLIE